MRSKRRPARAPDAVVGTGTTTHARAWSAATCLALSTEIFGVPVEAGNLESMIRGGRIAHPALDTGGRQVGEANVFPPEMRLDLPTKRRACPYHGSRHEHALPMNMTGLEPVQQCWRSLLHNLKVLKREYVRRRTEARAGLTVVDLYVLATTTLYIPAFMMQRAQDTIPNGGLPLEVSALFRVMDGVRITARDMLTSLHPSFGPDVVPIPERFFHYADREHLLIADRGVCAGSPQMIQTWLEAVMALEGDDEALALTPTSQIGDLDAAVRYGLAACELEAIADQFWVRHGALVDDLLAYLHARSAKSSAEQTLQARLEAGRSPTLLLFLEPGVSFAGVYHNFSRIIQRCHQMRHCPGEPTIPPFEDGVTATDADVVASRATLLRELPDLAAETAQAVAQAVVRLRRVEEQTFPRMAERQAEVNAILRRPPPSRAFDERDMAMVWGVVSLRTALSESLGITLGPRSGSVCDALGVTYR